MSANAKIADPVTGNSTLVRPRFSPGLLLRDDDLRQGVEYTRDLSRLLFRSLFGCGVICGLAVETRMSCGKLIVTVNSGVGLTCLGDPVEVPRPVQISIDPTCGRVIPDHMWVILCRTEKCCAPRSAVCSCEDDDMGSVCTREYDQFEIRILEERLDCACGCPEPTPAAAPAPQAQAQMMKAGRTAAMAAPKMTKSSNPRSLKGKAAQGTKAATAQSGQATAVRSTQAISTQDSRSIPAQDGSATRSAQAMAAVIGDAGHSCWCADPCSPCYKDHYQGKCGCECCECECLVLARLDKQPKLEEEDPDAWKPDHRVRRFVRPLLMRDPQVWQDEHEGQDPCAPTPPPPPPPAPPPPPEFIPV